MNGIHRTRRHGFSLLELLIVLLITGFISAMVVSAVLNVVNGNFYRMETTVQRTRYMIEGTRGHALSGLGDVTFRTFDAAKEIPFERNIILGGPEYDHDLPFKAPRITGPIEFEEQSGRTVGKKYGFIVLTTATGKKEEQAIFVPYVPGPTTLYIRRGGAKDWHRAQTTLY